MFDTHCHLNFKAFTNRVGEVIENAKKEGIDLIVVPGTDIFTSQKAVEIAYKWENVYAAVGIHPHHVFEINNKLISDSAKQFPSLDHLNNDLQEIEKLLANPKVVAVGEVGMDRHYYNKTKYPNYQIDERFMGLQVQFLAKQIGLAIKHHKSIIFHNREAKKDFLRVVTDNWDSKLEDRVVFHCCEPDEDLLAYAKEHRIFIGVDGDITYRQDKQDFLKKIPLDRLVLETDSPFLLPIQLRGDNKKRPANEPRNLRLIINFISKKLGLNSDILEKTTLANSKKLFQMNQTV